MHFEASNVKNTYLFYILCRFTRTYFQKYVQSSVVVVVVVVVVVIVARFATSVEKMMSRMLFVASALAHATHAQVVDIAYCKFAVWSRSLPALLGLI